MAQSSVYNGQKYYSFSSSSSSSPDLDENFRSRLFQWVDENGDGKISPGELQCCLRVIGEEITEEDAKAMVESEDSDGDGFLRYAEFERLVGEEGEGEEETRRTLREAFQMYVGEEKGCITPRSLQRTLARLGEVKTIEDCRLMVDSFDLDRDGVLSFDDFSAMMI